MRLDTNRGPYDNIGGLKGISGPRGSCEQSGCVIRRTNKRCRRRNRRSTVAEDHSSDILRGHLLCRSHCLVRDCIHLFGHTSCGRRSANYFLVGDDLVRRRDCQCQESSVHRAGLSCSPLPRMLALWIERPSRSSTRVSTAVVIAWLTVVFALPFSASDAKVFF
ncbi:hypothetical protein LX36DRAFT_246721 [Colletotrichum falcatum]|nr:hypothetical protein LX36DRAFT_246721 [Colletotrichum falcatum]